ncbi:MAG: class I SAM-dependent methyltransferase [Actinomycetota bacterium]|nr:class I SAM-dependent methyltransferase [Actinomycetota bacterium]
MSDRLHHDHHDAASYGIRLADDYDDIYDGVFDTDGAVECLVGLAEGGRVLELGVGTGRIAVPLAERSLDVWGVDGSQGMLDRLVEKAGGERVHVVCDDFATTTVEGHFDLVLLLVNTIYAMPTQDDQVACFANAARHLRIGGRFVVEAWVPDPPRDRLGLKARRLAHGLAGLVIEDHDPGLQTLSTTQIVITETGQTQTFPVVHRYAWPAELDLMARINGMSLEHRWGDWQRRPFDWRSTDHISVWAKNGPDQRDA